MTHTTRDTTVESTGWLTRPMVGFDLETTGTDVETDRIVTACVVRRGGPLPTYCQAWLADPGVDIPPEAVAVHGITIERARAEGRPAREVIDDIVTTLAQAQLAGTPIVAMNAVYDLTLSDREARRHGVTPLVDRVGGVEHLRVLDPRVLDKGLDPYRRGRRTLTDLCRAYGVPLTSAHSADADATAAYHLVQRIAQRHRRLQEISLEDLHTLQIEWAAEQAQSLARYFRTTGRQGLAAKVRTEWPLLPHRTREPAGVSVWRHRNGATP